MGMKGRAITNAVMAVVFAAASAVCAIDAWHAWHGDVWPDAVRYSPDGAEPTSNVTLTEQPARESTD